MTRLRPVPGYPVVRGKCPHCGHRKPTWTPAAIIAAVRSYAVTHGYGPTSVAWKKATPHTPAAETVREVFGSMRVALAVADVPKPLRANALRHWTRSDVIQAIFQWTYDTGSTPSAREWRYPTMAHPSEYKVRELFGTWNAAIVAAGYIGRPARNLKALEAS